ncbi:Katanin p80 WD40 repeat-containing subunit B1 [Sesamum alatum]|uniref:Katanin p80 WD40 repeat-containing subunit B1 homolog n=1 Tax=Sesamum alatum TaxID=300844 RepID=A0AAE2CGD3_9LAMI|nr:Katanin p80 WD40 repeat-containing subunit B1 [Sesamum alatum]
MEVAQWMRGLLILKIIYAKEFVAHAGNVNCLNFGRKNCRLFITGGDDRKVNLWSIGKAASVMSLSGHTSPVVSAGFDSAEELVVAGSSSGVIKLWDMAERKVVRTLFGHRSYCTAVEFHPFGEFFSSGSMDTNLKIWDIRKKGCIHTYRGHTRGISTIRFSPDGRWVASGGFDNVVKVWDLTAGKLLHNFKLHRGHVCTIEFHPLEFLLATGSADHTVKFWDLEKFEMIGSARREATEVRSITFHPDGRSLFCGLDDSLKVYSWEPVICHDSVDMEWSTLSDLCIHNGKLLSGAYYKNSIALIEPYLTRLGLEKLSHSLQKCDSRGSLLENEESHPKSESNLRAQIPDNDFKEIKTIYVDPLNSITSKTVDLLDAPKIVLPSDSKEISIDGTQKQGPAGSSHAKTNGPADNRSFIVPSSVPSDGPDGKDLVGSRRESIASTTEISSGCAKPLHKRRLSDSQFDMEKTLEAVPCETISTAVSSKKDPTVCSRLVVDENAGEYPEGKQPSIKNFLEKFDIKSSLATESSRESGDQTLNFSKRLKPVKVAKGVAVAHGRTRSLVELFEKKEIFDVKEIQRPDSPSVTSEPVNDIRTPDTISVVTEIVEPVNEIGTPDSISVITETTEPVNEIRTPDSTSVTTDPVNEIHKPDSASATTHPVNEIRSPSIASVTTDPVNENQTPGIASVTTDLVNEIRTPDSASVTTDPVNEIRVPDSASVTTEPVETLLSEILQNNDKKIIMREEATVDDNNVIENLMQNHDTALSTFRSRLTKLQVVRHFWEMDDVKGAINALRILPDHSVHADVVDALIERMDVFTLDLFSCLLPVLLGLSESKAERHASISLEMLLKLISAYGAVIRSTVSAPPTVGIDLHAQERLECSKQCAAHLQNIQKNLRDLMKRGGVVGRRAQQLHLVLQQQ